MKGTPTPKHIRDAVLTDIKDNGMIAAEAARKHQVHPRLVYGWLASSSTVSPGGLLSEMNKLKRGIMVNPTCWKCIFRLIQSALLPLFYIP